MKERQTLLQRILNWARRQWRLVWLVALFACAFSALLWGLPALVNQTLQGSFDDTKSDLQALDPLQFLPKAVTPTPSPTPTPTPAPTAKQPCIYPDDLTAEDDKAIKAAITAFINYLGTNVDLPGYECFIATSQKAPRNTAVITATPTVAPTPTATPSPTKSVKPTKTPKPTRTSKATATADVTANGSVEPTASPTATPKAGPQGEIFWHIEWRPVDYSARMGDLLGEQFQVYSAEIRQSDLMVLMLNTEINGNQIPQVTLVPQQRLNAAYNLVRSMGFQEISATLGKTSTKQIDGKEMNVSTRLIVRVSSSNEDKSERISDIDVTVNEMSGKAIRFQLDDSWY